MAAPSNAHAGARELQRVGLLLPPVLTTEDIRRALGFRTTSAVVRLHRRDGLPLARVGRRFVITRQRFQQWLDERAAPGIQTAGMGQSEAP